MKFDAYPGMPHGHFNLWPHLKQSVKSQEDTIWHAGWLVSPDTQGKGGRICSCDSEMIRLL